MKGLARTLVLPVFAGLLLAFPARAATEVALDLGLYANHLAQRFSAPAGYSGEVSSFSGIVRIRPMLSLVQSLAFEPSFAVLVPWRSGNDGFAKTITSMGCLDLGWSLVSWWKWRFGLGLQWNFAFSQPGTVELNNGTGTSTFYLPGGTSHSFLWLVETGWEFRLSRSLSMGIDLWLTQIASSERRRFHGSIFLGVYL